MQTEINKALATLKAGGIILYPTDTIWGIGCDATNSIAIKKIYALKKRQDSKALISLVTDKKQLKSTTGNIPNFDITSISILNDLLVIFRELKSSFSKILTQHNTSVMFVLYKLLNIHQMVNI